MCHMVRPPSSLLPTILLQNMSGVGGDMLSYNFPISVIYRLTGMRGITLQPPLISLVTLHVMINTWNGNVQIFVNTNDFTKI